MKLEITSRYQATISPEELKLILVEHLTKQLEGKDFVPEKVDLFVETGDCYGPLSSLDISWVVVDPIGE